MIKYPTSIIEYKSLRSAVKNNQLASKDLIMANRFITYWRVCQGSYALDILVKMSNKKQCVIAKELGIKERHLSEMINGCNGLKSNITNIANYFNVKEDLFYVTG
jgi:hypothetical protein